MAYALPKDATLQALFTPMRFEATVEECIVSQGEIPKDLAGGFYRVGPTWKRPSKQGTSPLLNFDGMVQAITFENGRADFRNRWVRTPKYLLEEKHQRAMFAWSDCEFHDWRDFGYGDVERDPYNRHTPQGVNNVNVFPFAGQMLVSGEQGGPPMAIDPITLETRGIVDWSPSISAGLHEPVTYGDCAFTAHPKWDPDTGVLYGWTYRDVTPYVTLHTVYPDGRVDSRELWDAPYNTVAHDIWLTTEWIVMPFQPFIVSKERIAKGLSAFGWDSDLSIVLALIPRYDSEAEIRWIKTDLPPQFVLHTMQANVKDGKLTLDAPIFNRPPFPFEQDFADNVDFAVLDTAASTLGRWTVDLSTGATTSERLSDRPSEFPKVDERFYGKGYRWGCQIGGVVGTPMNSLVVTDMETLAEQVYQIPSAELAAVLEPSFAPRAVDAPEGDGYVILPVSYWADKRGEYIIFDTDDISKGPIATIDLPFAFGWTPHGHWMDFRQ